MHSNSGEERAFSGKIQENVLDKEVLKSVFLG